MDDGAWLPAPATWWRVGVKLKREPPTWAAVLSYLLVAFRHQANLARWPKPATLLPFACIEDVRADPLRLLQAVQFSAFSRKISDCFIASSCCEQRMRRAGVYNAVFDDTFFTLMNGCSGRFI